MAFRQVCKGGLVLEADHPLGALKVDSALNLALSKGPDVKEGFAAFREKRLPAFPGRPSTDLPDLYPWW